MSSLTPPEESTSHVHHHDSPNTPAGTTHTVLSFLEQATSREGHPDSKTSTVLGTAHNVLHRLTSSSSTEHAHVHATPSPEALLEEAAASAAPTVLGTAHNMLHRLTSSSSSTPHAHASSSPEALLEEAVVSAAPKVLGSAHNMLHRLTSSSSSPQHAHAHGTQSTEVLLDEAAVSAAPAVLGAAQNVISRLSHATSHATPHVTRAPQTQKPVPALPHEQPAEVSSPTEGPQQRAADSIAQANATRSVSSRGGGSGEGRAVTPPRGVARVTRSSIPAIPDAMHPPRPARVSHVQRRATGTYADSETAWHPFDDRDPYREKNVNQRLEPTVVAAETELFKSTRKAKMTGWAQNIALALQVLLGALTTALGAALSGKNTSVAVSILGGASTLVASYMARTKGTNEPQASKFRAQALDHFLREIRAFDLDHGHEVGEKWDDKINGFRLGLERILGNQPGSVRVDADMGNNPGPGGEKWGAGVNPNVGPGGTGNGKYPMTMNAKTGFMPV